ncbi:MAG: ABC transporter substrate-binding protein [Mesorhizobium sp.]|nr:ABC transporter substrate-binding protein [Mesorhizobium sp.]
MTHPKLSRRTVLLGTTILGVGLLAPSLAIAQQEPRRGGTMTVHLNAEQRILNPAVRAGTGVYIVGTKIVEPLVDLGADGEIVPVLATSWESSADGLSITFKLREGVKWHDGKPFTSADVQFSAMELWKKVLNYSVQLQLYLDAVDTPDAQTAVFRYSRPMPLGLLLRALCDLGYVAPRHVYEGTNVLENPANVAPIGTGPFKFVEYQRGQHIIAERNPEYWREGFPYLDKVVWQVITSPSTAAAAVEAEQVLISPDITMSLADINRLSKDERFEVSSRGNEGASFNNDVEFNFRRKELSDVRVRRAIVHAIDVQFFIDNFLYGMGEIGVGPIPTFSKNFYTGTKNPYPFDRAKAEALLDEAGYPRGADGKRFAINIVPIPGAEDMTLFATFMQQSLAEVGIDLEVVSLDIAGALKRIYDDWDFDLATGWHRFRGDPAVSTTVYYRSGAKKGVPWSNQFGWQSDEVDNLIDSAAFELDPAKRKELYGRLVDLVNADLPVWMATQRTAVSTTNRKVQNHHNSARWDFGSWYDTWVAE